MDEVLEAIKFSKNCFVVFSPYSGTVELLFTGLNEEMLIDFIVLLCDKKPLKQFLKMAIIGSDYFEKSQKKGMDFYEQARKFIQENFSEIVPSNDKEA